MKKICTTPRCLQVTLAVLGLTVLVACTTPSAPPPAALNDGELPLPADYKSWPKFLSAVQRPDAKQVREIYMNTTARQGTADKGFPNGSVFVMENYAAAVKPDGTLQRDAEGKLVKDKLVSVFVQGKNVGWGEKAAPALANGNWIYSAFTPAGEKSTVSTDTCRVCHLPQASKDFVHRYDEYFATRKTSALHSDRVIATLQQAPTLTVPDVVALHHVR